MVSLFAKSHADITVRHVLRDLLLVVGRLRTRWGHGSCWMPYDTPSGTNSPGRGPS
jgi:hypothetical protein